MSPTPTLTSRSKLYRVARRSAAAIVGTIAAIVLVIVVAVLIVTNSTLGHTIARRLALHAMNGSVHGIVRIGSVGGDLLDQLVLTDVSIADSGGAPFVQMHRLAVRYQLGDLLHKRIALADVEIDHPRIVLSESQNNVWNYRRIFPTNAQSTSSQSGFGTFITLSNVHITSGDLTVRSPWRPDSTLLGAARDSAIRVALSDESRVPVERVGDGYVKTLAIHDLTAVLPALRLADPAQRTHVAVVASLSADVAAFRPPDALVRDVVGTFDFNADSLWWKQATVRLPASRIDGHGRYGLGSGDFALGLRLDSAALADVRFLDPRLPDSGGMIAGVDVTWHGPRQQYRVRDLALRTGPARTSGRMGLSMGGSAPMTFDDTDLRFSGIDTRLVEQIAPAVHVPRPGVIAGHAALDGPMAALRVDVDATFDDSLLGRSRLTAKGGVGLGSGFRAQQLAVTVAPLQLALAATIAPRLPVRGTIDGQATLDGSTEQTMHATADLVHHDGAALTHLVAGGDVSFTPPALSPSDRPVVVPLASASGRRTAKPARDSGSRTPRLDHLNVQATFEPIDLRVLDRFMPSAKLHGRAAGPIRLSGSMDDLVFHSRLGVVGAPDSSGLTIDGHLRLRDTVPAYDVTVVAHLFNARAISSAAPRTTVSATLTAQGRGTAPAAMDGTLAADVHASAIDSITVDTLHLRAAVRDGQLHVDTAHLRALATTADIHGSIGLVAGRSGTLTYRVETDSLEAFRQFLPRDTGAVPSRPEQVAAAIARARTDSARLADSTDVERAIAGAPPPRLVVNTPLAIRRDTLAGHALMAGSVQGGVHAFTLHGSLVADSVVALGGAVRRAHVLYEWDDGPDTHGPVAATVRLDTATIGGFAIDSLDARVTYRAPDGTVRLVVRQDPLRTYAVSARVHYTPSEKDVRYDTLTFQFDKTLWTSTHPASIRWGPDRLAIDSVELRSGQAGKILVSGTLPTKGDTAGHIDLSVQHLDIGDVATLAQTDVPLSGELSMQATLAGTPHDPHLRGSATLSSASARTVALPNVFLKYTYDTTALALHGELAPRGAPSTAFTMLDVTVPINLSSDAQGSRVLDRPLTGSIRIDSLPLDVLPQFESAVTGLGGHVTGRITLAGTARHPEPQGTLALDSGTATLVQTGTQLSDLTARIRLTRDSISIDSLAARTPSTKGTMRVTALLDRTDPKVPVVNATVLVHNARVLDTRDRGRLDVDANLTVAGPTSDPYVYGSTNVERGVFYLAPSSDKHIVDLSQPAVFAVVDTTRDAVRDLIPTPGGFFSHLLMDVDVTVAPNTWVRNENANVEATTDGALSVHIDHATRALVVNGSVTSSVGEYTVMGKHFAITKGVATFIGTPQLNPTLQANGEYDVPVPGREALAIYINITGSVDSLRLALSSNRQPPISQSDLLSYLAFSRPTSGVAQSSQSSSLTGTLNAGDVVGAAGPFVANQLAAQAVGVLADQVKGNLARALDADVLDITTGNNYTDIAQNKSNALSGFFQNTQLEFGKYFTPQTYVVFQASVAPGASVLHRLGRNLSLQVSGEPLYLLGQPTLATNPNTPLTGVLGLNLMKSWKF